MFTRFDKWQLKISDAIRMSTVVFIIGSQKWLKSRWCKAEVVLFNGVRVFLLSINNNVAFFLGTPGYQFQEVHFSFSAASFSK